MQRDAGKKNTGSEAGDRVNREYPDQQAKSESHSHTGYATRGGVVRVLIFNPDLLFAVCKDFRRCSRV
jgi:hypothetical protein